MQTSNVQQSTEIFQCIILQIFDSCFDRHIDVSDLSVDNKVYNTADYDSTTGWIWQKSPSRISRVLLLSFRFITIGSFKKNYNVRVYSHVNIKLMYFLNKRYTV